ncbi:hypothetical protein [Kineococcus esterisolvens]|uniref:hypothetical protein n=1 Tax=unclassified Kineococcus TaxID=2621656 RepID=UPI003D7DE198
MSVPPGEELHGAGGAGATPDAGPSRPRRRALLLAGIGGAVALAGGAVTVALLRDRTEGRLSWAPPQLDSPVEIDVTQDEHVLVLDDDTDYVLRLPDEPLQVLGGLDVTGGRNVVLIGGEIRAPDESDVELDRRGVYLKGQKGTIHIEGVRLTGNLSEGFNLAMPDGVLQLQNVVVEKVAGSREGNHADIVQTWAGPRRLLIDGLSGSSNYQAMFLMPNEFDEDGPVPEEFDFRRMRLAGVERHGYMLWSPEEAPWLSVTDVQVTLEYDRGREMTFYPLDVWSEVEVVEEFTVPMPAGEPGIGYESPGYHED